MTLVPPVWRNVKKARAPSHRVGLDLGDSALKSVSLRREGKSVVLEGAVSRPREERGGPLTAEEVRSALEPLCARGAIVRCATSCGKLMIRYLDMPKVPPEKLLETVHLNRKRYVPSQYAGFRIAAAVVGGENGEGAAATMRVVVGGADPEQVQSLYQVIAEAGYVPESLELAPLAVANAFEYEHPELFETGVFAIADFGQARTFVTVVHSGEVQLTRQVDFGGETLTRELGRRLGFEREAAEELKLHTEAELERILDPAIQGLCRELRASLQYVELHGGVRVDHVQATGGCAASTPFRESLGRLLGLPVRRWDPAEPLRSGPEGAGQDGMLLGCAVGAALGGMTGCR